MKKILLTFALLIGLNAFAQDEAFITAVNKTTIEGAVASAEDIVAETSNQYKLLKTTEKANRLRMVYIPANVTPEDFKASMSYDTALVIDYTIYEKVPGIKTVKLERIKANYNDVFPTWKKYFNTTAESGATPNNYKMQRVKGEGYKFSFSKEMGYNSKVWTILNQS